MTARDSSAAAAPSSGGLHIRTSHQSAYSVWSFNVVFGCQQTHKADEAQMMSLSNVYCCGKFGIQVIHQNSTFTFTLWLLLLLCCSGESLWIQQVKIVIEQPARWPVRSKCQVSVNMYTK